LRNIFQEQAISGRAPVVFKSVVFHPDVAGIHHGHTGPVFPEDVAGIHVAVREHKVQSVAVVALADVVVDHTIGHVLKVDAVAVPLYFVIAHSGPIGAPHVYGIAERRLYFAGVHSRTTLPFTTLLSAFCMYIPK
jgi:hypothetical protein